MSGELRAQLDELAGHGPGWFDGGADGYWGVALDPGCIERARALAIPLAEAFPDNPPGASGDPTDGSVSLYWWRHDRHALTIYAEPDGTYMALALGITGPFTIDRTVETLDEATRIASAWLRGEDAT